MKYVKSTKTIRRAISLCFSIMLCFSLLATNAFAASINESAPNYTPHVYGIGIPNSGEPGNIGITRALAECGGRAHDMLAHGWGSIYNVDTNEWVVSDGACAQCTRCNLVIITENDPGTGVALGWYTSWQPYESLSSLVTVVHQSSSNIFYTSSTTIPGASFRYA